MTFQTQSQDHIRSFVVITKQKFSLKGFWQLRSTCSWQSWTMSVSHLMWYWRMTDKCFQITRTMREVSYHLFALARTDHDHLQIKLRLYNEKEINTKKLLFNREKKKKRIYIWWLKRIILWSRRTLFHVRK